LQFTYSKASIKNRLRYRRSLRPSKREHPVIQNIKFLNFFLFLWAFCPSGSGSGSTDLVESGSVSETLVRYKNFSIKPKTKHGFPGRPIPSSTMAVLKPRVVASKAQPAPKWSNKIKSQYRVINLLKQRKKGIYARHKDRTKQGY
jgi:hypothetical protein